MMILLSIFSFFKNIANGLISFFSTKVGQIVLMVLVALASLWYANYSGYKKGVAYENTRAQKVYIEKLNNAIAKAEKEKQEAVKDARETAEKEKEIITIYKDRVKTVERIIQSPAAKCKLEKNDFNEVVKILKDIK